MVSEAVGVGEDAASDHEAVCFGVFGVELVDVGEVLDVAVNDELGGGADLIAEVDDLGNELIVGGDFGHFFLSTEVDGEGGRMLL